jgi:hypothetical protein
MATHHTHERTVLTAETWLAAEEESLARTREVCRRITDRVRRVTEDTDLAPALGTDPTGEYEPVR